MPSSADATTANAARNYWLGHIANRSLALHIKSSKRTFSANVHFDDANTHMWTRGQTADEIAQGVEPDAYDRPKQKGGPRMVDPVRAVMMDRLFSTIASPFRIHPGEKGRHVYLSSPPLPDGGSYIVVLSPKGRGEYEFVSAHPRPIEQVKNLRRQLPVLPNGKEVLHKNETPPGEGGVSIPGSTQFAGPYGPGVTSHSLLPPLPIKAERPAEADKNVGRFFEIFKAIPAGARWITA